MEAEGDVDSILAFVRELVEEVRLGRRWVEG